MNVKSAQRATNTKFYVTALTLKGERAIRQAVREEEQTQDLNESLVRKQVCKSEIFSNNPCVMVFTFSNLARASLRPQNLFKGHMRKVRVLMARVTYEGVLSKLRATMRANGASIKDYEISTTGV